MTVKTEAEIRQWWHALALALQRQSFPRLDVLGISPGGVRDNVERLLRERQGWEQWELFIEAVFETGEDAFVKLVGDRLQGAQVGEPVGIVGQPEWTQRQIDDMLAASEKRVKAALRRAKLEADAHQETNLD